MSGAPATTLVQTEVTDGVEVPSRADMVAASLGVAREMERHGFRPGDRVVLKADNSAAYVYALLALAHLDASLVLLDHRQTGAETRTVIEQCRVRWVIGDGPDDGLCPGPGAPRFLSLESLTAAPGPSSEAPTDLDFSRWQRRTDALVAWSTGSTGRAKAIVKPGGGFLTNLRRTVAHMGYRDSDTFLPLLPFSHQYGLSLIFLAYLAGASMLVSPFRRIDLAIRAGAAHGATIVDATPATYRSLLNLAQRNPGLLEGLEGVRLWCTGGSPLDQTLSVRFRSLVGAPLLDGYGSTELGNVAFATPAHPLGCGRTLKGIDVRVAPESGDGAPGPDDSAGAEFGQIWVRSPDGMAGYLEPDGTIREQTGEWYRTGDFGYLSDDGDLFVIGRSHAVHRMGHLLYPEALAAKASGCGRQVVVVPVDDERWGSRLIFVVADPDEGDPQLWRELICSMLASYEHPNHVVVVPDLPLNRNGKIDTGRLRLLLRDDHPVIWSGRTRNGAVL
ncbi:class I adenylate-forming enzyme family protein [Streptomyces sp. NPDC018000]|uniref:class I adenylate-forming enzyme family protein n=1 Tax=Streptomyces sp. NPDC018000 TaxID=3365028 RepID=UPI0037983B82